MQPCLINEAAAVNARPVWLTSLEGYGDWLNGQAPHVRIWLSATGFQPSPQKVALIPALDGGLLGALLVTSAPPNLWDAAALRAALPEGNWRLPAVSDQEVLGWMLASYRFDRYRSRDDARSAKLVVQDDGHCRKGQIIAEAICHARDLINTPANDLGPAELEAAVKKVAQGFEATVDSKIGDELLGANFPAIHAVGRASRRAPRVVDLRWGDPAAPKVTLVGKGVCFDSGGLDIKTAAGMLLMKKDMGGAAVTLAVAQAIMALNLPIRLRLLIGAVENSISGDAFRPGDVLRTRKGLSVEIGNTDAEGRLVLADLLALGDEEAPDLMIDCATLTGAARVALGPDLPALFTPDDRFAEELIDAGKAANDPLWRMPLHGPYREMIDSPVADINNAGSGGMAGSITAALFLQDFVSSARSWAHLDIFCWHATKRPGRPKGGEATALRALLGAIERRYPRVG